ncbi:hypothetical protein RB195_018322 [Necator americanus]|uniref:Piwi domain-containing protein n=1 Tax=Necator americanus TaxID=51031 RepID=A0ABR1C963_NECAM
MARKIDPFEQLTTQVGHPRMRRCGPTPALTTFAVYAPTSSYKKEVEAFYMDLEKFCREDNTSNRPSLIISKSKLALEERHKNFRWKPIAFDGERLSVFIMNTAIHPKELTIPEASFLR